MRKKIKVIDLFCGIGGMTHGFVRAKMPVSAGFDIDESCQFAYEANNKGARFFHQNITKLSGDVLTDLYGDADVKVLIGCAPCQPFSTHSQRYNKTKDLTEDSKWGLLYHFVRLIKEADPDIVSMENVPTVVNHQVFKDFVSRLNDMGYTGTFEVVYCPDYGIPQRRKRLVLLYAKQKGLQLLPRINDKSNYETVRSAIAHLPPLEAGAVSKNDPLHISSQLYPINLQRIRQSKPGGTWHDWDQDLLSPCHQRDTGKTYTGVYGRMEWDVPGPTITTQFNAFGTGRFGHPEQDRALSIREGAILQTFPDNYQLHDISKPLSIKRLGIHIGNAVPVRLGEVIAHSINSFIRRS